MHDDRCMRARLTSGRWGSCSVRPAAQGLLQEVLEQQPADPMAYFCTKIEEIQGEMKESQVRKSSLTPPVVL